jgi:hypothetical protein
MPNIFLSVKGLELFLAAKHWHRQTISIRKINPMATMPSTNQILMASVELAIEVALTSIE